MSAKEKLDKTIAKLKSAAQKMKPYLDKTTDAVKATSAKVGNATVPLIKESYTKVKKGVDTQIKEYHAKKEGTEQKKSEDDEKK